MTKYIVVTTRDGNCEYYGQAIEVLEHDLLGSVITTCGPATSRWEARAAVDTMIPTGYEKVGALGSWRFEIPSN